MPTWVPQNVFSNPKWCRMFSINGIMIYKIEENTFQKRNDDAQWKLNNVLVDYDVWQRLQNGFDEDHQERNSWPLQTKTVSPQGIILGKLWVVELRLPSISKTTQQCVQDHCKDNQAHHCAWGSCQEET